MERKRRKEREKGRTKGERKREKRKSTRSSSTYRHFDGRNSSNQEVKSVYSTRTTLKEVGILHISVYFYPLGYCFELVLGPCCVMFMAGTGW